MTELDEKDETGSQPFGIGNCEIRPEEATVARGGVLTRIEPKVMAVLVYLARHRGRVVPKDELLGAVWPDTVVEEVALARSISELRRVLGDDARHPRFIETHHRRGYRLLTPPEEPGSPGLHQWPLRLAVGSLVALVAVTTWLFFREAPNEKSVERGAGAEPGRIVVLPFVNMGSAEDEYFSEGMTEEITSRLASVRGLAVISRTSSSQYGDTSKTVPQIAEELGVDYVLEGSVRWEQKPDGHGRVRVTPQLIRASDDTHLWSRVYDRDFSRIFALQSELAREVIEQIGGVLREEERESLTTRPTESLEAYDAYLRGLQLAKDPIHIEKKENLRAIGMFERAVELDPDFALAHAELSLKQSLLYHYGHDRSSERLERVRRAAERAVELQPDLALAHVAMGKYHYRGLRNYDRALEEYWIAESGLPNDSDLQASIAYIRRRQGRMNDALARLELARDLDPRNAMIHRELGLTHAMLRQYPQAEALLERAISLAPDLSDLYSAKAWVVLLDSGDWAMARAVMQRIPGPPPNDFWVRLALWADQPGEALERLASVPDELLTDQVSIEPRSLLEAFVHEALGDGQRARAAYEAALRTLREEVAEHPDDFRIHMALGLTHAGLGDGEQAVRYGRRALDGLPISKDANGGPFLVADLARIYVAVGEYSAALEQLERLLSIPAGHCLSVPALELDPAFAPLRGLPGYRRLVGSPRRLRPKLPEAS